MASLGVLIPTRNSMRRLPEHLKQAATWIDLAAEVVVVDSLSEDGTVEYLRERLQHCRVRILSRPPGLYESWNYGVQNMESEHTYISTVGDTITREGLRHLIAVAEAQQAEVVMSKPRFVRFPTGAEARIRWPIDDILVQRKAVFPLRLRPLEMVIYAAAHPDGGLLGSSASNLYRTVALKRRPFPTIFGVAGDGAWAVMHAHELSWSVTPSVISTFMLHPTDATEGEQHRSRGMRLDRVLASTVAAAVSEGRLARDDFARLQLERLFAAGSRWMDAKEAFDQARAARFPWSLNPASWLLRMRRNRCRSELDRIKRLALQAFGD